MRESAASRTAYLVAVRRAEHQVLDRPPVFEDPLSLRIMGPDFLAGINPGRHSRRQRLSRSFRAYMAVRSRYAEDELARAVSEGVRQYVVLGAGLDMFAYRNPHTDVGLRVFEVDHPATQAWKRECLVAAGIDAPPGSSFVAADFETHSLAEVLADTGFHFHEPAIFSWLGVVPYLTDQSFDQTMRFIAERPAGSAIVLDYSVPRTSLNTIEKMALDKLAVRVANVGEPLQLFFESPALAERLHALGYRDLEDLGREEMNTRYFAGRPDGLCVKSTLARLLRASV
jgi:methyltransferase (TIGR00027 family)